MGVVLRDDRHLLGFKELGDLLQIDRNLVQGWWRRRTPGVHRPDRWPGSGFPLDVREQAGLQHLSMGQLFDVNEILQWWMGRNGNTTLTRPLSGTIDHNMLEKLGIDLTEQETN